jgi:hypothetical protein
MMSDCSKGEWESYGKNNNDDKQIPGKYLYKK